MSELLQKDLELKRIYKPENNGLYDYELSVKGEPVKVEHSAHVFDFALVNVNGSVHMELYRNSDSVPAMDLEDANTFIVAVTTSKN